MLDVIYLYFYTIVSYSNIYHNIFILSFLTSAVHRSRRAGAGVLTYFAGAGVCSPPVKL